MTAAEVKDAIRRRHPALAPYPGPGEWTCLEEFLDIDLVAFSAWSRYRRIGYEVKVSRSDYRRELLRPSKRHQGVSWCDEFYFAVPAGLLTGPEIAFVEPVWEPGDFSRDRCPGGCYRSRAERMSGRPVYHPADEEHRFGWTEFMRCETCEGRGYLALSRVELEAPTLWVPRDVGLLEVDDRFCRVVRKPPRKLRAEEESSVNRRLLAAAVRHASYRPDPRHVAR